MTRAELVAVLRNHTLAVQSSVAPTGAPQAAVVGFAVTDALEIIFDTVATSRKYRNLRADPRVALVIGWEHEITVQIEGVADVPVGDELERVRACYFVAYPDGRERARLAGHHPFSRAADLGEVQRLHPESAANRRALRRTARLRG